MTLTDRLRQKLEEDPDRVWSMDDLISHLYPNPDHEPENPDMIVRVLIRNLRAEGLQVHTHRRLGYSLGRESSRPGRDRSGHLPPKAVQLLEMLERRGGRHVSIDSLVGVLFPGRDRYVAYSALRIYVSRIRRVLGRDAIETTPGGYRREHRRRSVG